MTTGTPSEPRPVTVAVPDDTRYEHKIPRKYPTLIQVRPVRQRGRPHAEWNVYMACDTPENAKRILYLLNNPVLEFTP